MQQNQTSQSKKVILFIIIVVLAILFILLIENKGTTSPETGPEAPAPSEEIVVEQVEEVDGVQGAPEGLPEDLPVGENITESYTLEYPERGLTQRSVTFISQSSIENLSSQYQTFMEDAGYTVESSDTKENIATLYGTTANTEVSVVISKQTNGNQVQVSYLER